MGDAGNQDAEPGPGQEVAGGRQGERGAAAGQAQGEEADRAGYAAGGDHPGGTVTAVQPAASCFAENGHARTSIRAIAAEADVNHALVVTYFGGKEALFMEAVGRFQIPRDAILGDIEGMGARIARAYMERWENMAEDDPWLVLVRSSLSHEGSYSSCAPNWRRSRPGRWPPPSARPGTDRCAAR